MTIFQKLLATAVAAITMQLACAAAWAQASCSNDGQRPPVAMLERFISADCETCWTDLTTVRARQRELALDWIVPGAKGDDAPLSAAASRDAHQRLDAMRQEVPQGTASVLHALARHAPRLRVAHGVALGGYIGTSIELKVNPKSALLARPLTAWLLLVEVIPAGMEGTPVPRNLVRNALVLSWKGQKRLYESRPMSIPAGANPERLQVVGWVEDAGGRIIVGAASVCAK